MTQVLDAAWTRPTAAQIKAAGFGGLIGYVSHDTSKDITTAEVHALRAAGLGAGLVFESTAGRSTQGAAAGRTDAQLTVTRARAHGMPTGTILYAATDSDQAASAVLAYYQGFAAVVRAAGYRAGAYGGIRVTQAMLTDHAVDATWQTVAWSAGRRDAGAHLYQHAQQVFGGACDVNDVLKDDWGWTGSTATTSSETTIDDLEEVITTMKATHIIFQHGGALGVANVLAGTYWIAPDTPTFLDRCFILRQAGAKLAQWADIRTGAKNNIIDDLDALGVRIK